jgi:4-amino-4-deoxy-L-arabinose transferase-like glycosyltransferase
MEKIHRFLEKLHIPNWLAIILFAVLILRIPSFFEPYSYGDEMIYMTLGQGIRQGIPLYSGLYDNKPPILYLITAAAGSLVWFKIFLAIAGLISIGLFAKIVKEISGNEKFQKVATIIFALLTTLPLLEGNIANAENFMMATSLGAIYLLLAKKPNFKNLFLAGILFGISFLIKVPALFDLPVVIIFWLITRQLKKENIKKTLVNSLSVFLGFLLPIIITFVWFLAKGHLPEYLRAVFLQNVGYVSSWRPGDVQKSFFAKNLPLLIRAFIVFAGTALVFIFRKKLSKNFVLASVWTLLALFAVTLSERPYPHYLLQAAAPIAVLLGIFFTEKSLEQSLVVIPLFIAFFVPVYYKFWYYPTAPYYLRFIKFVTGNLSRDDYFTKFDAATIRNYKIANFLAVSSYPTDKVFVWGPDSPAIYALSRRLPPIKYVADYHINDYSNQGEVKAAISQSKPRFIVLTPEASAFPQINSLLKQDYLLINKIDGAEIYVKTRNSN